MWSKLHLEQIIYSLYKANRAAESCWVRVKRTTNALSGEKSVNTKYWLVIWGEYIQKPADTMLTWDKGGCRHQQTSLLGKNVFVHFQPSDPEVVTHVVILNPSRLLSDPCAVDRKSLICDGQVDAPP
jgi:hypothetical protein